MRRAFLVEIDTKDDEGTKFLTIGHKGRPRTQWPFLGKLKNALFQPFKSVEFPLQSTNS